MRKQVRGSAFVIVMVAVVVLMGPSAEAHYLETGWVNTYNSGTFCVEQITHQSHSSTHPGGFFRAGVQSSTDVYSANCGVAGLQYKSLKAAAQQIHKWDGSQWALCKRNPTSDYAYKDNVWRWEYDKGYGSTLCGSGYYRLYTVGWAYHNGTWKGGRLLGLPGYSSETYHYLPSGGSGSGGGGGGGGGGC